VTEHRECSSIYALPVVIARSTLADRAVGEVATDSCRKKGRTRESPTRKV
jgi:hypothetical protein